MEIGAVRMWETMQTAGLPGSMYQRPHIMCKSFSKYILPHLTEIIKDVNKRLGYKDACNNNVLFRISKILNTVSLTKIYYTHPHIH